MENVDVAIIGAGPAGCTAAVQCTRLGLKTLLIEKSFIPGGLIRNANKIENYPGTDEAINGIEFTERLVSFLDRFNISPVHTEIKSIYMLDGNSGYKLHCDRTSFTAKSLILACGTKPKKLDIPGESESGNRTFYEIAQISATQFDSVTVIGSGEAALDYSLSLEKNGCKKIQILCRSNKLTANESLKAQVAASSVIEVQFETTVVKLSASKGEIITHCNSTSAIDRIVSDIVLVAIGRYPAIDDIKMSFAFSHAGKVQTNRVGLFIVGDARIGSLGQLSIAAGDGMEAALEVGKYLLT